MNITKRIVAILIATAALIASLTSCYTLGGGGTVTVVVAGDTITEYDVYLERIEGNEGLISVLDYLKENEGLSYSSNDAGYGAYLTEVGEVKQDPSAGKYVYIYTNVEADFDVSQYASTVEYKGETLTSAGVGASSMRIEDGAVIYITYIIY